MAIDDAETEESTRTDESAALAKSRTRARVLEARVGRVTVHRGARIMDSFTLHRTLSPGQSRGPGKMLF
jgi:aspartate carbamoyltransferase catalytic subunit